MENFTIPTQYNVTESMTNDVELNRFQCFTLVFVLGGLAAVIAKSLGAPVERIKLIQQILYRQDYEDKTKSDEEQTLSNEEQTKSDEEQTKSAMLRFGLFSCAKYIYQTEGLLSFWRGNLTNCLRYVPKMAFDMAFKEELKIFFKEIIKPGDNFGLAFLAKWLSGTVAACCSTVICYPLDFIRTSLAVDMGR